MVIEHDTPFYSTRLEEEREQDKRRVIPVSLNKEEQEWLDVCKQMLEQPKDSTALKLLAEIGKNVLHDKKTGMIIQAIFKNKVKNKRTDIIEFE